MLPNGKPMYSRTLKIADLLEKRSHFLFGPRATGKSTLIASQLPSAHVYDLLDPVTFQRLLMNPSLISQETSQHDQIVIDEVQKLPQILDEVHRLIFSRNQKFLLTGSSARKLNRRGTNLLAGRAFRADLFPLTSREIPDFDLLKYVNSTGLPEFYGSPLAKDFLHAYVGTYLQEEIQAESLTRNLPAFTRFLEAIALSNGEEMNFASISSDCGVPVRTLAGYLSLLADTLLGFEVPAFVKTAKRKAVSRSKHYLFDIGVVNTLANRGEINYKSELFGRAFEHFIALELRAWLSYTNQRLPLQYWRSTSKFEVDFVIGNSLALEVKGTDLVSDKHLKGIRALKEEGLIHRYGVVSRDPNYRLTNDGIEIWPWKLFLDLLWEMKLQTD
jgi:predicted AAA+ superfamily ATPase